MITIGYDFQGWPMEAHTLREFMEEFLGLEKSENGDYIIKGDNPLLDAYPKTLEDDGMGYGIHPQYVYEVDQDIYDEEVNGETIKVFNLFREPLHDLEKDKEQLEAIYDKQPLEDDDETE